MVPPLYRETSFSRTANGGTVGKNVVILYQLGRGISLTKEGCPLTTLEGDTSEAILEYMGQLPGLDIHEVREVSVNVRRTTH